MTSDLAPREPDSNDDGFGGSLTSGRLKGAYIRWSSEQHWQDRDGLASPSQLLVVSVDEILRRWTNNRPEVIDDKPLPDPDELNAAIPQAEWEKDLTGQPRKPWAHEVVVRLVHPGTGGFFTYSSPTAGAHIAVDNLREAVVVMRALRGQRVVPLVELGERPMKTKFGPKTRPHFEIVDWKTPGARTALPTEPAMPQLPHATAPPPAPEPAAPEPASQAQPPARPQTKPRAKPAVNLGANSLAAMGDLKPTEMKEFIDDSIPW